MNYFLRIDFNLFATVYLGIVFYLAYQRLDHEDAFNQLFFKGCIIIMAMTLFEAATCLMNRNPSPWMIGLSTVLHLCLLVCAPLMTYYWLLVANMLICHGHVCDIKAKWQYLVPVLVIVLLTLLSPKFHFMFYFDENGAYHRGYLFWVDIVVTYAYLTIGFLMIIKNRKKLIRQDSQFLTLFCLMPMIGGLVQALVYGVLLIWGSSACALTIMYMYLQERMVQTDYLTGAWTRSSFEHHVAQKLLGDDRKHFGVVYVDIDNLKRINDEYGHREGDTAIKAATAAVKSVLRKGDAIARLGGDEFAVLLNIDSHEGLNAVVERIGAAIRQHNDLSDKPYRLSLSLGADLFTNTAGDTVEAIVSHVDKLMYNNKRVKKQAQAEPAGTEARPPEMDDGLHL